MKTRLSPLLLASVLAALTATALTAAPSDSPAKAFRISAVEQHNQPAIESGSPEFTVRRVLGEPRRKLDANTWLYDRFSVCDWKVDTGDCTTLMVTFVQGKVSDLKLVNERAEKLIAANLAKQETPVTVAKK